MPTKKEEQKKNTKAVLKEEREKDRAKEKEEKQHEEEDNEEIPQKKRRLTDSSTNKKNEDKEGKEENKTSKIPSGVLNKIAKDKEMLKKVFQFLPPNDFNNTAVVNKEFLHESYLSVTSLHITYDDDIKYNLEKLIKIAPNFKNLEEIVVIGIYELTIETFEKLLKSVSNCHKLKKLTIQECDEVYHINCALVPSLESVIVSYYNNERNDLKISCGKSVENVEFCDSNLINSVDFHFPDSKNSIKTLKFSACLGMTEENLLNILNQFDDTYVKREQLKKQSKLKEKEMFSPIQTPAGTLLTSTFFNNKNNSEDSEKKLTFGNLENLVITESEPFESPLVFGKNLKQLAITNCPNLKKILINCEDLNKLRLCWNINLDVIHLNTKSESLKLLDLTECGTNIPHANETREKIYQLFKDRYPESTIYI